MEEILVWFESNLLRVGLICGAITAVSTVIYFLFKHGVKQPLEKHITDTVHTVVTEKTKNIATDANGGQSLNDIAKSVKEAITKIDKNHDYVTEKIDTIEERQSKIYDHIIKVQETQVDDIRNTKRRIAREKSND